MDNLQDILDIVDLQTRFMEALDKMDNKKMTLVRFFGLCNDTHKWYFVGSFFDINDAADNVNLDNYAMIKSIHELEVMIGQAQEIMSLTEPVEDTW